MKHLLILRILCGAVGILFVLLATIVATSLGWASGGVPDWEALDVSLLGALVVLYVDHNWTPQLPQHF